MVQQLEEVSFLVPVYRFNSFIIFKIELIK